MTSKFLTRENHDVMTSRDDLNSDAAGRNLLLWAILTSCLHVWVILTSRGDHLTSTFLVRDVAVFHVGH